MLTGAARPSARPFTTGSTPGDPFGPPSATLRQSGTYRYPTEFDPPDDHGRIALSEFTFRNMGTELEANISPAGESGTRQCQCLLNHMFAPPEEMEFFSLPVTGRPPGEPNGVTQPVFRSARITSGPFTLEPDSVCLAGMTSLPTDLFPEGDRLPRRLLLFLKFVP